MTELGVTEDLVEKASAAIFYAYWGCAPKSDEERHHYDSGARAVLAAVVPEVRRAVAEQIAAAFEPLLYNSPDGDEFAHTHPDDEGEPECPACWVQHIRQTLAREIGGVQ